MQNHCEETPTQGTLFCARKGCVIRSVAVLIFSALLYNMLSDGNAKLIVLFLHCTGYAEPVAHEGALKIKEMTYMHAEGYGGGKCWL